MKRNLIIWAMLAALAVALLATPAWAQMATVNGKVVDEAGKPIVGASVTWKGTSNGRNYTLKTDAKGQYFSIGVAAGTYDVTVTDKDGKPVPGGDAKGFAVVTSKPENTLDFDLGATRKQAEAGLTKEQKEKLESQSKEANKVKGLNDKLAAAREASKAGNYDQAITLMKEATESDPSKDLLWAQLGDAYLGAGKHAPDKATATERFSSAAEALQKAIEIKATVGAYHNNLGEAYAKSGKNKEAMDEYTKAAQLEPTEAAKYYFNLGAILTNGGQIDAANEAFDKVLVADPNYAEAYYQKAINMMGRATVDEKTGAMVVPPEVTTNLNKYLELSPNGPNAQAAKDLITSFGAKIETSYGTKKPAAAPKKK